MMNASFPQAQVVLEFLNGPLVDRRYLIDKREIHIGSSQDNDIVIPDRSILPQHAVLYCDNGSFLLHSLDAQDIVEVNQHPIPTAQWVPIDYSHRISLGQSRVTFCLVASNPVPPAPTGGLTTDPHAAMRPARPTTSYDDADTTRTLKPTASPASTSPRQAALPATGAAQAPTETTRYLCMAAHIDQEFRNYVFRHIVKEKHRAIGESHGVDIPAVVKSCYTAQQKVFIRDAVLCALLVISLFLLIISTIPVTDLLNHANPLLLVLLSFSVIGVALLVLVRLALTVLFVLLAQNKKIPALIRMLLLLIAFFSSLPSFTYFPWFILLYLTTWGVIVWNLWDTYYGAETQQLTKGKFNPGNIQFPLDPQVEFELRNLSDPHQNVIVYSEYSPFVGSGIDIDAWSFAIDAKKGKQKAGATLTPELFQVEELYKYADQRIHDLRLPKLTISDKLYVSGKAIPYDPHNPNGAKNPDFFDNFRKRPITRVKDELAKQWMEAFSEDVRYYKCFRVTSWNGELIVSIFVRFMQIEKNLFVEANYMVLPPLKEEYYLLDTLEPTFTLKKLWDLAGPSFFSTFVLWFLSPLRVIAYLAGGWFARRELEQIERLIVSNPTFDYGASTSLREVASSSVYRLHFQRLDKEMYVKIIERQILESIIDFLDSKNIDTTDLKERQEAIFNHGVIVSGGTVESLAFGEKARATSNRFTGSASNARETGPQRTSQK